MKTRKGKRSDKSFINHQRSRFAEKPKASHRNAVRRLACYLNRTRNKSSILKPKVEHGLEVYVDADISGKWDLMGSKGNGSTIN